MMERRRDYSWLDNGQFVKDRIVLQILMANKELGLCCKARNEVRFNVITMHSIMDKAAQINQNLSVLCYALPRQPPHSFKFLECKIKNSTHSKNMFKIHGVLFLITKWVKYEELTQRKVFIPIKVPPELQELLEIYLLSICPMEIDIVQQLYGADSALLFHEYLYVEHGQRIYENSFSHTLHSISSVY